MLDKKFLVLAALLVLGLATLGSAQIRSESHNINFTIGNIFVLDVDNAGASTDVGITISDPVNPGAQPAVAYTNNVNYLNYTSVVENAKTHKISAKLTDTLPGVAIHVIATAPTSGYGSKGTSGGLLTLSKTDQTVISAIGSCWTGIGGSDGALLTYSITFDDANFANLLKANPVEVVTYTISD